MNRTPNQGLSPGQLEALGVYGDNPSSRVELGEGVEIERFGRWRAGEIWLPATSHHRISIHVQEDGNEAPTEWNIEGERFKGVLEKAMIAIIPAGNAVEASWHDTASGTLNFMIPHGVLAGTLEQSGSPTSGVELIPGFHGLDPVLLDLTWRLMAETSQSQIGDRLMRDALKMQMLIHVLRHYSNRSPTAEKTRFREIGTSKGASIQAVLDYMHEHLDQRIGLEDLAKVAGLSSYHFLRVFRRAVGITPMQELNRLRIERARQLILRDGSRKSLAAIAAECGFADQSHLGRQFKKHFGVTPGSLLRST